MRQAPSLAILAALGLSLAACDDFTKPARADRAPFPQALATTPAAAPPAASTAAAMASTAPGASETPTPAPSLGAPAAAPPDALASATPSANPPPATSTLAAAPSADPRVKLIEASGASPGAAAKPSGPLLVKFEVLLDRAHFSPGTIDGRRGSNLRRAIAAFETARGMTVDGKPGAPLLRALESADGAPITQDYAIGAEDEKGPFVGTLPIGFQKLAALKYLGYSTPLEGLAEKFHMSQALLRALNPKADFTKVATTILVVRPGDGALAAPVAKIEVDKAGNQVRALDGGGRILAAYPATVGSTERPAPSGQWAVKTVVRNPDYSYDPKRLTFGDKSMGALRIAPGPNNPVGSTWIALTTPTYGIHGSPDPAQVGKSASHGCVRLTNWDAAALGRSVAKGTPVVFLGVTTKS